MSLAVLALLLGTAHAGDLEIIADRSVWVRVDDRRVRAHGGDRRSRVVGLDDGTHTVEIRDLLGRLRASLEVAVEGEERVLLHYGDRDLVEVGRGHAVAVERAARELAFAAARATDAAVTAADASARAAEAEARVAAAQASAAQAAAQAAALQEMFVGPGLGEIETGITFGEAGPGADPSPGGLGVGSGGVAISSASFAGLDPTRFAVLLDDRPLPWVPHLAAFVATDLTPGVLPVELQLDGQSALSSELTTEGGRHTACTVLVRQDGYDTGCTSGSAPLTSADLLDQADEDDAALARATRISMPERLLQVLLESVAEAPYQRDKVAVLESAASRHLFSCAQVARVIEPIEYNDDRLAAVEALRPAIVDPENHFQILEVFPFKAEQDAVKTLFAQDPGLASGDTGAP